MSSWKLSNYISENLPDLVYAKKQVRIEVSEIFLFCAENKNSFSVDHSECVDFVFFAEKSKRKSFDFSLSTS